MSQWRDERNALALARLKKALPVVFPAPVLVHALGRRLIPPLPRLAVESYWAAHPLRADRLARALARRSGAPDGWLWQLSHAEGDGKPRSFRVPPMPFREAVTHRGPGACCICGQPVYRFGWHSDLWGDGKVNRRATWHACCVAAWRFWLAPNRQGKLLRRLQKRACANSGGRLWRHAEVDHRIALHRVWRDHREKPWPDLLAYWGFPNLQLVNKDAHRLKSASEATERAERQRQAYGTDLRSSSAVGL